MPDFLTRVFDAPDGLLQASPRALTRHEYLRLACIGGFPEVVARRSARSRSLWFRSYLTTVTQREIRHIARVRHLELLPRMFRLLAALTAQELNVTALARDLGLDDETVRSYLPLLETVFLVHRLPAWSRNLTARVKRRPKMHLTDTGLAAWLMEQGPDALARPGNPAAGYLLETPAGRVVGMEVKAASTVRSEDFRHLTTLRDRIGDQFVAGVVFFTGERPLRFGDRLIAVPISLLWGGAAPPSTP